MPSHLDSTQANVKNQYDFGDPRSRFPTIDPPEQQQDKSGVQAAMTPTPNIGEDYYIGSNRLKGRRALVVGGDSGIGAAVSLAYAREGADVVFSYLPGEENDAEYILALVKKARVKGFAIALDLTTQEACKSLVKSTLDKLGGIDTIAIIAGKQVTNKDVSSLPDNQFVQTFALNVFAPFRIIKAALPHLQPGSTIVTTASLETWQASPERIDYASTKGAINTLSKGLAQQLIEKGIRVNTVAPGPTWTALQVSGGIPIDEIPQYGQDGPIGRAAQPAELAPAYVFFASPESSYVVGATLSVNGGIPTP